MKNTISLIGFILVLGTICGCKMNTTYIELKYNDDFILGGAMDPWDTIGTPLEKRHIEFNQVVIQSSCGTVIKNLPNIYIGLPTGEKYYLPKLDVKTLESISYKITTNKGDWLCEKWHRSFYLGWNEECYRGYWQIIVDAEGNFCMIRSGPYKYDSKKKYRPVLWDSQLKKKYILPLTWNDAIELFGKPVDLKEALVW